LLIGAKGKCVHKIESVQKENFQINQKEKYFMLAVYYLFGKVTDKI
jgi:hypothetical protein